MRFRIQYFDSIYPLHGFRYPKTETATCLLQHLFHPKLGPKIEIDENQTHWSPSPACPKVNYTGLVYNIDKVQFPKRPSMAFNIDIDNQWKTFYVRVQGPCTWKPTLPYQQ